MGNGAVQQFDEAEQKETMLTVKYPYLIIRKGNVDYHYVCKVATWNYWLGRYYPKAELDHTTEHLNNGLNIKTK